VTSPTRTVLAVSGLAAAAYGLDRLLVLGWSNLVDTVVWLAGGVLLHDALFAPLVLVVSLVGVRFLPRRLLGPAVVVLVILVPVTLVGIPELGRLGADPRNPTLLDRRYWLGWSALATLVLLVVGLSSVALAAARARRSPPHAVEGGGHGTGDGGR
jgi:hypothetical protein